MLDHPLAKLTAPRERGACVASFLSLFHLGLGCELALSLPALSPFLLFDRLPKGDPRVSTSSRSHHRSGPMAVAKAVPHGEAAMRPIAADLCEATALRPTAAVARHRRCAWPTHSTSSRPWQSPRLLTHLLSCETHSSVVIGCSARSSPQELGTLHIGERYGERERWTWRIRPPSRVRKHLREVTSRQSADKADRARR
jgi:hypothetical protein